MKEGGSVTALRVAMRRAAHQLLDRPPVHADPLALRILGAAEAAALRADPLRRETGPVAPLLRAFLAVRSRIAEDELALAFGRGVRQYVVLGAGLDTFAYRNPHAGLRVFELDHPASQAFKRERLADAGIDVPASVILAAIDFTAQQPDAVLRGAGLEADRPAFFSWLGVTPYLESGAVLATLACLAPLAAGGGGIVFDYSVPPTALDPPRRAAFEWLAARVRAAGEPFRSFFEPAALAEAMRGVGWRDLEDHGPATLNERYFRARADGLRVGELGHVVCARA